MRQQPGGNRADRLAGRQTAPDPEQPREIKGLRRGDSPHIDYMTSKAFRALGFIRRHSTNCSSANCLLALYNALVRSVIEYGSIVWSPYTTVDNCRIDRVQNSFMRFAGYCLNIPHPPHDYRPRLIEVDQVDAPRLLGELNFRIPSNTRLQCTFYIPTNKSNFSKNASLIRMMHNANNHIVY
ncbi:uncharacterized protein LOC103309080 [Acyrthosiphon pisum]|uniref:Reverse transcriptase domain-containing protein n=1 Tax=Acyrthosiphon pisum TaxID=7029 RepID=A0A8R2B4X8_ACYPI|nr:uncharacterized protein LOC103309080 [Acyrthosiphon pisum]|eukprot:XP_008181877.1 PREDICTED: uncharacterized protein LOC103309080 [Acyrthosiphon pisum]